MPFRKPPSPASAFGFAPNANSSRASARLPFSMAIRKSKFRFMVSPRASCGTQSRRARKGKQLKKRDHAIGPVPQLSGAAKNLVLQGGEDVNTARRRSGLFWSVFFAPTAFPRKRLLGKTRLTRRSCPPGKTRRRRTRSFGSSPRLRRLRRDILQIG